MLALRKILLQRGNVLFTTPKNSLSSQQRYYYQSVTSTLSHGGLFKDSEEFKLNEQAMKVSVNQYMEAINKVKEGKLRARAARVVVACDK